MTLVRLLLLFTVFLIPLLGSYKGFGYEQIKVLFFIVSVSLSGFVWLIYLIKNPKFKWSGIAKAAGILMVVLLVTSLMGVNPTQSILGTQPYFQGWILYAYLFLFFLLVRVAKIKLKHWAYVLVGSATIVGLLAIKDWVLLNFFHQLVPNYAGRVVSTFGQPNFYAGFILLSLPFFRFLLASKGDALRGWVLTLGFLISIVAIILSYSRTAYLLLAGLMIVWLVSELVGKRLMVVGTVLATGIIIIFSSVFSSSGFLWKEIIEPTATINPDLTRTSVENRVYIWPVAWQLVLQRSLIGYGLENISQIFSDYFTKNKHALFEENLNIYPVLISLKELNIDRSHNYVLDLLLFSGILGLLTWIILMVILIKQLIQSKISSENTTLLVGLLIYLIWIQFQNQSIVHLIYFWLLVGMIDKMGNGPSPSKEFSREA